MLSPTLARFFLMFLIAIVAGRTTATAGTNIGDFESPEARAKWAVNPGPEFPGAKGAFSVEAKAARVGKLGGALEYDFTGGGAYVEAAVELPGDKPASGVKLWIRNVDENPLGVRVTDSTGQTFQKRFNIKHNRWQQVLISFSGWEGSWGGQGDRVFHGNPTRLGILATRTTARKGVVHLDDVRLVDEIKEDGMDTGRVARYAIPSLDSSITYDFTKGGDETGTGADVSILGMPEKLIVRVNSAAAGHKIRVKIGSHFQTFDRVIGTLTGKGDQTLEVPLGGMNDWTHYGGENDGIVRFPLRIIYLGVVKGDGPDQGEVKFTKVEAETRVDSHSEVTLIPSSSLTGEKAEFSCRVLSLLPKRAEGKLLCSIRDYSGRSVSERVVRAPVDAGESFTSSLDCPFDGRSFLECEFRYTVGDRTYGPVYVSAAKPLAVSGSPKLEPESPFGIGVYLYRYRGGPEQAALMQKAAKMAMDAGVKWSREEISWNIVEPEKGRFDWSFYDRVVDTAIKHGISVYGLIDYWSKWTKPYTKEGIEDYARYCTALVTHYKDKIKYWEIWNEPNIFFWSGPKELYPELLKAAYKAIKEADPEAKVLGCSTSGIDRRFIRRAIDAGAPFDDLTIHPYRGELDDEEFIKELEDTAKLVNSRPIWITEMGWPTQLGAGVTERDQAKLLARTYLCAIASGEVRSVSWYDFREDGNNPFYNEHRFGIVRHRDLSPKPAYLALATLANSIGSRPVKEKLNIAPDILAYRFGDGEQSVIALWPRKETVVLVMEGKPAVRNLMGETLEPVVLGERRLIAVEANDPVVITGVPNELECKIVRLEHPGETPAGEDFHVVLKNAASLTGLTASLETPNGWQVSKPQKLPNGHLQFTLKPPASVQPGSVQFMMLIGNGKQSLSVPVQVEVAPEVMEV